MMKKYWLALGSHRYHLFGGLNDCSRLEKGSKGVSQPDWGNEGYAKKIEDVYREA